MCTRALAQRRVFEAERRNAFYDAVLSIIATVNVVPLAQLEESEREGEAWHVISGKMLHVGAFTFSFVLVATFWVRDIIAMCDAVGIDERHVAATIWQLLGLSLMPVGLSACYAFGYSQLSQILFVTPFVIARGWSARMVWDLRKYKHTFVAVPGALKFAMFEQAAACGITVLAALLLVSSATSFLGQPVLMGANYSAIIYSIMFKRRNPEAFKRVRAVRQRIGYPTPRIEAFTDGVYAIAATLIVLEFRPGEGADHGGEEGGGGSGGGEHNGTHHEGRLLAEAAAAGGGGGLRDDPAWEWFAANFGNLLVYGTAFLGVLLHWKLHHRMTFAMRTFTLPMVLLNHLMCQSIALVPLAVSFANYLNGVLAQSVLGLLVCVNGASAWAMLRYAEKAYDSTAPAFKASAFEARVLRLRIAAGPIGAAVALVLSIATGKGGLIVFIVQFVLHAAVGIWEGCVHKREHGDQD